jgi:DNA primase
MVMRLVEWQKKQPNPRYTNEQLKEAVEFVSQEEPEDSTSEFDFPSFDSLQEINTVKPLIPFPEDWLSSFLSGANHVYRVSRGISLETAYRFDIRYDTLLKRLCFPLRSITGTLYGMQGRDVTGKQQPKYHFYDYKGIKNPVVWGNEQHVDLSEPLIITEGFPDAAKIDTAGFRNVVACLTSKFSRHKYERLQDAKNIITFFDYGTGGDTGRLLVERYWKHAHVMHVIPDEEEKDAGNMSVEAIQEVLHGLV